MRSAPHWVLMRVEAVASTGAKTSTHGSRDSRPSDAHKQSTPAGRPGCFDHNLRVLGYGPERRKKTLAGSPACDIDQKDRKSVPSASRPT